MKRGVPAPDCPIRSGGARAIVKDFFDVFNPFQVIENTFDRKTRSREYPTPPETTQMCSPGPKDMLSTFSDWQTTLTSLLARTEARYELGRGEVLTAAGPSTSDLHELYSYGWTPEESAQAITETLGLR